MVFEFDRLNAGQAEILPGDWIKKLKSVLVDASTLVNDRLLDSGPNNPDLVDRAFIVFLDRVEANEGVIGLKARPLIVRGVHIDKAPHQ